MYNTREFICRQEIPLEEKKKKKKPSSACAEPSPCPHRSSNNRLLEKPASKSRVALESIEFSHETVFFEKILTSGSLGGKDLKYQHSRKRYHDHSRQYQLPPLLSSLPPSPTPSIYPSSRPLSPPSESYTYP